MFVSDITWWVHWDHKWMIQDEKRRYGKQFWKDSHELERVIKIFKSASHTAFHHRLLFPTLIHYKLPSETSVSVQNKNSNSFFKNTRKEKEWLHQCGRNSASPDTQCTQLHIYVQALLLLLILDSAESLVILELILADMPMALANISFVILLIAVEFMLLKLF